MMDRTFRTLTAVLLAGILLASCDRIDPDDYWIPLPEDEIPEDACTVLVEEYTGQHCINCPDAARLLQAQKKIYKNKMIVVSMHAPRTGMTTPELAVPEADRFAEQFGHERSVPGIMINREMLEDNRYYSQSTSLWAAEIRERIMRPATYAVEFQQVTTDKENRTISVTTTARGLSGDAAGGPFKMRFWMVEDVIAPQALPVGQQEDYFHHNVFRGTLGTGDDGEYELQAPYTATAELPANIKVLDNAKVIAMLTDGENGRILGSSIYPLGKGISPEPDSGEHPGPEPDLPEVDSETLHFNIDSENFCSESVLDVSQSILIDPGKKMYAMDSPLIYILPGKTYGIGNYGFTVTKMDHEKDVDAGLMMVCVDGKCMPAENTESYSGQVSITSQTLETRQSLSVHTYIQGKASDKADTFRYRITFFKEDQEIAYLILKLNFTPSTER